MVQSSMRLENDKDVQNRTSQEASIPRPHGLISVIIPAYNCEKWLGACLESVQAQTYTDWQAIIVDDGSSDKTGAIADTFAAKDSRFRVIHQQNGGSSVARNTGLGEATGDYVYMLDGDDRIAPYLLEHCIAALEANPDAAFVTFDFIEVPFDASVGWETSVAPPRILKDALRFWIRTRRDHNVWSQIYRASSLKDIRFKPGIKHEDLLFQYRYLIANKRGIYLPEKLHQYILTPNSLVRSPLTVAKIEAIFDIIDRLDVYASKTPREQALLRKGLYPRLLNSYRKAVIRANNRELRQAYDKRLLSLLVNKRVGFRGFSLRKKFLLLGFIFKHLI